MVPEAKTVSVGDCAASLDSESLGLDCIFVTFLTSTKLYNPKQSDVWKLSSQLGACGTLLNTDEDGRFSFTNTLRADTFRIGILHKNILNENLF